MNLRFAQKEDVQQIISLCEAHARHEKVEYDSKNKFELLSEFLFGHNPSLKCLVLVQQQTIKGYATFMKQFSTWDANWYVYLDCLFLMDDIRGKGFGIQIMEKIKEYALKENCNIIQWQTPNFNKKAILFYHGVGAISKTKERFFWEV